MSVLGSVEREMARVNRERNVPEFVGWPKTPRLFRDMIITEKIDGTNACVVITAEGECYAQSRNRMLERPSTDNPKGTDNQGFRAWVDANAGALAEGLGEGHHYGEWWGQGIQRTYDLTFKVFSLFNTGRWTSDEVNTFGIDGLDVVPVLYQGTLNTTFIQSELQILSMDGSRAAPGFMRPEGVCVYLPAARQTFKALIENDDTPKSVAA